MFIKFLVFCSLMIVAAVPAYAADELDFGMFFNAIIALKDVPLSLSVPFFLFAVIGLVSHFVIDVWKGIIPGGFSGLIDYLFITNKVRTIATIGVILVGEATWFANNLPEHLAAIALAAIPLGYAADSVVNKGKTLLN